MERKGHAKVLTALSKLKRSGELPAFRYDIVGAGPMEATLREMVSELRLEGVYFHGAVSEQELEEFYRRADVFVMPVQNDRVDKEGFGFVFIEAAVHGVSSISTRIPGVDEAIMDGQTGILVDPEDAEGFERALLQCFTDPEYRQQLGQQAHARVEQEFFCENQFAKMDPFV